MVGGRDRIIYDEQKISELLKSYKERKKIALVCEKKDEEIEFLDKCIKSLEDYEKDLVEKVCIENISVRAYSKNSGFSRDFITKRKKYLLELISKFFNIIYEKNGN